MGFRSFIKKIFAGESVDESTLDAARARHGIKLDAKQKVEADQPATEGERFGKDYDIWEDLRHFRANFFVGSWVNRKFHVIGEDKVKKQLEDLEKKRRETAEKEKGQGE